VISHVTHTIQISEREMEETWASYRSYDPIIFMVIYEHMLCLRKISWFFEPIYILLFFCRRKSSKYN
jgi:hypothetical protein